MSAIDEEWLMCAPVVIGLQVVKGSHTRRCELCGRNVWVAPSGLKLLRESPGMRIACLACGAERYNAQPVEDRRAAFLPLTPDQLREIREHDERNA